jgi:uncharacterized protein
MGSSIFFLNVQERGSQSWERIRRLGFISSAGCPRALDAMSDLLPGDTIAAFLPGRGYVGVGVVLSGERPQTDHADYKLPVRWLRAFDRNEAKWSPQIKAPISNQPVTLRYLQDAFGQDAFGTPASTG